MTRCRVAVPGEAACLIGCVAVASRLSWRRLGWGGWQVPPLLPRGGHNDVVASYSVNPQAVAYARQLIDARQYVLDSDWGKVQPWPQRAERIPTVALVGGIRPVASGAHRRCTRPHQGPVWA
jgi:hypothetical protein